MKKLLLLLLFFTMPAIAQDKFSLQNKASPAPNAAIGDIYYASSTTAITRLGIGSTGAVLFVSSGVPAWAPSFVIDSNGSVQTGGASANYGGYNQAVWRSLSILGNSGPGLVSLGSNQADDTGRIVGAYDWFFTPNTGGSAEKRVAQIVGYTEGSTATQRGGKLVFTTKADAGSLTTRLTINNSGNVQVASTLSFGSEYDNGNSGAAKTIDWNNGNKQRIVTTASCTLTFTAPASPTNLLLKIVHEASATAYTYTYPVTVLWPGGTKLTTTNASGAVDIVSFYYDGTSYHAVGNADFK